jgi:hypothetical protein
MLGLASDIFLGPGTLAAGVAALVLAAGCRRFLAAGQSERSGLAIALAAAFFIGFLAMFASTEALLPEQAWQWLPYVGIAAATAAALPFQHAVIRWPVLIGLSIIVGGTLTPRWPIFGLGWPISIVVLIGYSLLVIALLELCSPRQGFRLRLGVLALDAAIVAAAVGAEVSIVYGQLAAVAAAGLAGCWASTFIPPKPAELSLRALTPVFSVLVGGVAFTACVEPEKPLLWLLVLPLLPLAACPFARRTIS